MNIHETKLFKEHPRTAIQAEVMDFTYEDINYLYNKIQNDKDANTFFNTKNSKDTVMKMMLFRVGLERNNFFKHVEKLKYEEVSDEELIKECGLYSLLAYKAIIK